MKENMPLGEELENLWNYPLHGGYLSLRVCLQIAAGSQTVLGIIGKLEDVDAITGKLKLLWHNT